MFCKWCGGTLTASDKKCKRCGREVPALSDCGGFYDVVPGAATMGNPRPAQPQQPTPARAICPETPEPVRSAPKPRKKRTGLTVLLLVVNILLLVIALILNVRINKLNDQVEMLKEQLLPENVQTEPEAAHPENKEPEATGPSAEEININGKWEDGEFVIGEDDADEFIQAYNKELSADALNILVQVEDDTVSVSFNPDTGIFGAGDGAFVVKWYYDNKEVNENKIVPEGSTEAEIEKRFNVGGLHEKEGLEEDITLCCEVIRKSQDGGKLKVTIENIQIKGRPTPTEPETTEASVLGNIIGSSSDSEVSPENAMDGNASRK